MTAGRLSRSDGIAAALLWLATVVIFGAGAARLGFYVDDGFWLAELPSLPLSGLWEAVRNRMPGRNLHVVWLYSLYKAAGNPMAHLPALHLVQSGIDGLVVAAFYVLLRLLNLPGRAALLASAGFAFWPLHGQTHFLPDSLAANQISTLFTILFAVTRLLRARGQSGWRLAALEAAAFAGALFTYDQVLVALLVVVAAGGRFRALEAVYVALAGFHIWLRLTLGGGPEAPASANLAALVAGNALHALSITAGRAGWIHVAPLYSRTSAADWLLALLAAAAVAAAAWRAPAAGPPARRGLVLALAAAFWAAAYLPIWLWYPSPRHHYLPSAGLFAAAAVVLSLLPRLAAVTLAGGMVFVMAAACRGESRFWEESFVARRQLFAELSPQLAGKQILALENFPASHGPALLVSPHDAHYAPQLLERRLPAHGFVGTVASAPAPGGIFVETDSPEGFRYHRTGNFLVARFTSWENGSLRYQQNPVEPLPYDILSARAGPGSETFRLHRVSAARRAAEVLLSLDLDAPLRPGAHLALVLRPDWGHSDRVFPLLLASSGGRLELVVRLARFPPSDRLEARFYQASPDAPPALLGRAAVPIEP